jgi:hypothetical protein
MSRTGRNAGASLLVAALVLAVALSAWCAWAWARHPTPWVALPPPAAWGLGALQAGVLLLAHRRGSATLAALSAALSAAGLLLADTSGDSLLVSALPAGLWLAYLAAALDAARWRSLAAGTSEGLLAVYATRAPLLVVGGLALGTLAVAVPAWAAAWLGGARWAEGVEVSSASAAGMWVLALFGVGCSLWLATRRAPAETE